MYKKIIKKIIKKVKEFYYTSSSERFIKYLVSGGGENWRACYFPKSS